METKSRRPGDSAFKQQRLPAWQPILSPRWVIASFFIIAAVFIPIGAVIIYTSDNVVEVEVDYTESCTMVRTPLLGGAPYCSRSKLEFDIPSEMKQPVYMYYKLENFYQNHRRYSSSRSDSQLSGNIKVHSDLKDCDPILLYMNPNDPVPTEVDPKLIYNPCGLIAWSMFNDTFNLYSTSGGIHSLICNGPNPNGTDCTKNGIAWKSDVETKFKMPADTTINRMYPATYYNESSHVIPRIDDEDFIVWMRTAALPNFRKLYRIINKDLPAGKYSIDIEQRYPVSSFGGRKKIILSTLSWIGGKNTFLGAAYVAVGSACAILAIAFLIKNLVAPRDPSRQAW